MKEDVFEILNSSGIGVPKYYSWRSRSGCYFCFFQQKSRKEAAKELGITNSAVSIILSQAIQRLRKKYLSKDQTEKVVAI